MPPAVFLKERFELTPAEARLVLRLIAGESLRSAAKSLNIGYETARTTLKSVFHKTGTCRQAELVIVVINAMNIMRWYLSVQSTHDVHCINDHDDQFGLSASTSFVKNRLKGRARRLVSNIEGLRGRPQRLTDDQPQNKTRLGWRQLKPFL